MHVARNKSSYVAKSGEERVYESVLLRRTFRDGKKVKHETLANLSKLPREAVDATADGWLPTPTGFSSMPSFAITRLTCSMTFSALSPGSSRKLTVASAWPLHV